MPIESMSVLWRGCAIWEAHGQ